jgi:hypothetical protein
MSKSIPVHTDILDRALAVGDYVVYPYSNTLRLGKVEKLNPKMIKIQGKYAINKYPKDTAKLEGPDLVMYLLKK